EPVPRHAVAHPEVEVVDAAGAHPHPDLPGPRLRRRQLLPLQDFRSPVGGDAIAVHWAESIARPRSPGGTPTRPWLCYLGVAHSGSRPAPSIERSPMLPVRRVSRSAAAVATSLLSIPALVLSAAGLSTLLYTLASPAAAQEPQLVADLNPEIG